jgi:hypothetical protein
MPLYMYAVVFILFLIAASQDGDVDSCDPNP